MKIRYEVVGKAAVEELGNLKTYSLKLLYKGDGIPWWTCNASLDLKVTKEYWDQIEVGKFVELTLS